MKFTSSLKSIFLKSKTKTKVYSRPISQRVPQKLARISPDKLELVYVRDGLIFNAINKMVQEFLTYDFDIVAANTKDEEEIRDFMENCDFRFILLKIVQNLCIYGNCYIELIKNETGSRVVSLDWIDPKTMDFKRDNNKNILYGDDGLPVGYVQHLPYGFDTSKIDPEKLGRQDGKPVIKFDSDEIVHFRLYTIGDSLNGIGLIEPVYNTIEVKMNIENGLGEAVYRRGYPIIVAKCGNENKTATQEDIDWMDKQLRNMETSDSITIPEWVSIEYLESRNPEKMQVSLKYFVDLIIAGLGIPRPYITGISEDTNKATLEKQDELFRRNISMLQKSISNVVEDKIFSVIAEERDFGAKPKMVWQDPHKMERLKDYVNSKLLTVDTELENIIRKTEKLPELKVETARPAENEGKDDFEERIEKKKKDKIPGEVK